MIRPNLAMDAPPTKLMVGGLSYPIHVDFRVWIGVIELMRELYTEPRTLEEAFHNADTILEIEQKVFGRHIEGADPVELLGAVIGFTAGYPQPPVSPGSEGSAAQRYSFEWDINAIILAIRNQSGIDLSYRREEPFHWWLFLEEFRSLCGDHYILRLMDIRGYSGKDSELKREALRHALPRAQTADDRRIVEQFNELFYNA